MEIKEKDYEKIFEMAKTYLLSFKRVDNAILEKHLNDWKNRKPKSMNELLKAMLDNAKNRQGMPNAIGNIENLRSLLFNFEPNIIVEKYDRDWKKLFYTIHKSYTPPGRMEINNPRNYWVIFCKTVLSASKFLSRFSSITEFDEFVTQFYPNEYTRLALPLLLKEEIYGYGFALACDFLKENGYPKFVKPDVHIKDIFSGIGISNSKHDYEVFKDVIRFSKVINEIPYVVDKLFWLVGSGYFYLTYPNERIKTDKRKFIEQVKTSL